MNWKKLVAPTLIAMAGLVTIAGSLVFAAPSDDAGSAEQAPMPLPPGWTEEDMQACMLAATPGEMHAFLTEGVGVWHGKNTMWMGPDSEPVVSESTSTISLLMDGRYTKLEMACEMPGMGPFNGFGINGFDNVSQEFVSTWVDNQSTGIMNGVGELSADGKTLEWKYTFNCPLTKKPTILREIETITGPDTRTLDMFSADPKTGKEYQMMHIELSRNGGKAQ
jgi:hypothetical protein